MRCGNATGHRKISGKVRAVCPVCGWIHFADPKVAAAVLVEQKGEILLVLRRNEPAKGLWSLPAGFVDAGEDPASAASRECLEETGMRINVTGVLDVVSRSNEAGEADIIIIYKGELISGSLEAGDDASQAAWFPIGQLPPIAFESTRQAISNLTRDH